MPHQPLKIIFMGTPDFAVASLDALITGPDQVVAVVSQPDKKQGRGKKLAAPAVKKRALEAGIPVLQPEKIKTQEFLDQLRSYTPDLIVVAAYGRILPASILQLAPLGCINVHGSILPKYRGAAPIQWAVINGDKEAGVTIMQMDEGMDTGDILHIAALEVDENETAGGLFWKLAELGGIALLDTIEKLKEHEIIPIPQNDNEASHAPMLKKTTATSTGISLQKPFIIESGALTPGHAHSVFLMGNGFVFLLRKLFIWKAILPRGQSSEPIKPVY